MPRVGIREVAALADVSMGTVSHFLNHPTRVSAEKAKRIQEAIEKLGFVRNNAGRQLRLGRSSTVAYIVPDVSNPFFATIAEGVERRAAQAGLSVFLANSGGDRAREDSYLALFEEQGVRGMLVASHDPIEDRLAAARTRGTPSVLVGRRANSAAQPSISIDDVSGGYLAARHLIEIGCRRIAFVGGPLGIQQIADRLQGASNAVRESGTAMLEIIDIEHRIISVGHKVGAELSGRPAEHRPDGIFAVNDLLGIGLVQTLVGNGVRVPEDIAVVGYDDIEYAENSLVPLTSVRPPHEDFGIAAVDLLLTVIGDAPLPAETQLVFAPDLVVRRSTTRG
ncbi:LacI family DNA-binding transcriptional regulator [Plantactinospora mayteni]|uniref:LacI family transcriptional regulator n=1 Tax=Plantactinospora mayteni TaxID=566021 RepID=A0ABQ4F035_9ACTN|nr:LacI family DNA-binding transcriptional regulator [Plantactinospora mayteni]GIH00277.1 LacI family transcriptional regulator [Plantactinospora mayteni]